jgi:poly(3-hydroxybutyrate) depolymerase
MLYAFHEIQKSLASPMRFAAQMGMNWAQSTGNPWRDTPPNDWLAASSEMALRLTQDYPKRAFDIREIVVDGKTHAIEESVVSTKSFCELRRFAKASRTNGVNGASGANGANGTKHEPRVLLVAPLSGHFATLLRDTVQSLVQHHEVFVTDWKNAREVPLSEGLFHLDDYVHYVIDFLHELGPNAHVISVCQPTVPVMCAVSLMAANNDPMRPKSMVMMGGPIDTRVHASSVNEYATKHSPEWFERNVIARVPAKYVGFGRRVYPGFLQHYGFVAMNPGRHAKSHWEFFLDLLKGDTDDAQAHRRFYDEYNAVLDLDAAYYLETVRRVFQEFHLPRGVMEVRAERVDPSAIRDIALMTVEGELDDISLPGQTYAAHGLCSNIPQARQKHLLVEKCGHYGIFSGSRWRKVIYPEIREFIASQAHHGTHVIRTKRSATATTKIEKATSAVASTTRRAVASGVASKVTAAKHSVRSSAPRVVRRGRD